jgi:starch-binding outer membrane protein, SusD/RagB family
MTHTSTHHRAGRAALALAGLAAISACNLDVVTPDVVPPSATSGASALPTLLAGAVGDFAVAYAGVNNGNNGEGIVLNSGLFTDEFTSADYFSTHIEVDGRRVQPPNGSNTGVMRSLFRALTSANSTAARYVQAGSPNDPGHARVLSLAGYVYTLISEDYCSGVPFSTINDDGSFNYGSPLTSAQMRATALAKFDSAITVATAAQDDQQRFLAEVGKARVLLDGGQFSAAAAAVADVPDDFNFSTEHGVIDPRTENGVYALTWVNSRYTTTDNEGGNGLAFVSAADPRLVFQDLGTSAFDSQTEIFAPDKYSSYSSPVAIATGTEARLIEAEAALQAGSYPTALGILDALRAAKQMGPLVPAATPSAQVDQLFAERAFWLFGTAHRMGDLRRLVSSQYGRAMTDVYPSGRYAKGTTYGDQVAFPVPQTEENNPNFTQAACDPTKP